MQDRATATELLDAISRFLRNQSAKQQDRWLRFQLLVASNSLAIVQRELEQEESHLREEWPLLDGLLGAAEEPTNYRDLQLAYRARQDDLCDQIRAGEFDSADRERELIRYLVLETKNRVRITAPQELGEASQ
jgi:hypothetical protein